MKMLMTMLAVSLVFVGCSDAEEPVALEQEQEVISDAAEEADEQVVSDVDSEEDVLILDVEQSDLEVNVEEGPEASFRNNPDPGSHFFTPEIP